MSSWTGLSPTEHASKRWRPREGFRFAASYQAIPIFLSELSKVLPHYATAFIQTEGGDFQLTALVGLGGARNLYLNNQGKWLCHYVPASVRVYPFALLADGKGNKVFCLREDHFSDDERFPRLFQDSGTLETSAAESLRFATLCEQHNASTARACAALNAAELLEPWSISISRGEGKEPLRINGLYRINENKLAVVDGQQLEALRGTGALQLAYAQIFSMAQIEQLIMRADYLSKEQSVATNGLDGLFGSENSGTLNFDAI